MMGVFVLFYVPKLVFMVFQLSNDMVRLGGFILSRFSAPESKLADTAASMSRSEFLTKIGIVAAAVPFISIFQGITYGRFNYKVKDIKLSFDNLPDAFNGFRVLQVSDWHIGSFLQQKKRVREAVDMINDQKADIILFTGDMVNNVAEEMKEFIPDLKRLKADNGVFSILGNHDYGEYVNWDSEKDHAENMEKLYAYQSEAGLLLLRNDSIILTRDNQSIGIAGVENWGLPPFPQYGDLGKSLEKIKILPFKILMSHDPSHWDGEIRQASDVDLTLSGHTHGMQFGINIPGLKWSPVKWKYPRWSGLYTEDKQHLYVNVGIGYIGFPGRVGFYPEITVFTLQKKS
jgi:hypothetical protein